MGSKMRMAVSSSSRDEQHHQQHQQQQINTLKKDNNLSTMVNENNIRMTHQHHHHHHHHHVGQQNITNNNELNNKNIHEKNNKESFENITLLTKFLTHFGFYILMFLGFINHLLFKPKISNEKNRKGYAPLYENYETFYLNYVYRRIKDCWNQPICSVPGAKVTFKDRITRDNGWTFEFTGTESQYINLGSYNYLGFAESSGSCANKSIEAIKKYGITSSSPRVELGSMAIHKELELLTARYLQVEDAIVFGMGFATNSLNIPTIVHQGCLVLSDEKNHASTILGLRLSGATIKKFKHNDMNDLNKCLKYAIVNGQINNNGKPWKKILIIVEGIYSMEGSIVNLPEIISLKKKYKAYVYLDEAHSTGAMGKKGRGICNYYGIDPKEIDILMGTFTKSFGSSGGYIAGNKKLINYLRLSSHANVYAVSMSPPIAQQIITSMKIIMGEDGTDDGSIRIKKLAINTKYFRRRLNQIGLVVYGSDDSPIVPMIVYHFSKITSVVRYLRSKNIATVGVGFPATEMMLGRIRFCISAAHTKQQLDYVLESIEEMADLFGLRYSRKPRNKNTIKNYSYDNETE